MAGAISIAATTRRFTPRQTIEINGVERPDARVDSLVQSSGIQAAALRLWFPHAGRGSYPARDLDKVSVWLDKHLDPRPKFVGRIMGNAEVSFGARERPVVAFNAVDLRHFLSDAYCSVDYNVPNRLDGELHKRYTSRQIVVDLYKQYKAHQATISGRTSADILGLELSRFPDQPMGEFAVRGEPHGVALQRLVELLGDGDYRLYIRYQANGQATLSCYKRGQGHQQFAVVGTDVTAGAASQPFGAATVGAGQTSSNSAKVVNEVVVESRAWMRETALPLGPLFDVSKLDTIANKLLAAQEPPGPNVENASYDPQAAEFGRAWEIPPQVDADGVERRLEVLPELLQANDEDPYWTERPRGPALIYRFSDEDDWIVLQSGFSIQNHRRVETEFPLIRVLGAEESETIDRPVKLTKLEVVDLASGGFYGLFWRTASPVGFSLAPWVSGEREVRDRAGGQGQELNAYSGGPIGNISVQGNVWMDAGSGHVWYGVAHLAPTDAGTIDIEGDGLVFEALKSLVGFGRTLYLRDLREIDDENPAAEVWALPTEIYLEAGFLSSIPLSASSGKQGPSRAHVKRLSTSGDAARHVLARWFALSAASGGLADYTVTQTDWTDDAKDAWEGDDVTTRRDDSPWLETEAVNKALTLAQAQRTDSRVMPYMPTAYDVGPLLNENGRILGNIVEVAYDFHGPNTRLSIEGEDDV